MDKASLASTPQWIFVESGFVDKGFCFCKSGEFRFFPIVVGVPIGETGYLGLIGLHDDVLAGPLQAFHTGYEGDSMPFITMVAHE